MKRRSALLGIAASTLAVPTLLRAQAWPSKPIRLIVGWPAGGSVDTIARLVQPALQEKLGTPVVIDNRGGASGAIGARAVATAPPDGYTWLLVTDAHATNESFPVSAVKALETFRSASLLATGPMVLAAHPSAPYKDVRELAAEAKRRPGAIAYASAGSGGLGHVATVLLEQKGRFKLNHVPFKGGNPALQAVLGGHVPLFMANSLLLGPYARDGRLRALGVGSEKEIPQIPGVTSFIQQGFAGALAETFYALVSSAGTPTPMVERMNAAMSDVLRDPGVRDRIDKMGMTVVGGSPDACQRFLTREVTRWEEVIRENHIKLDA
ncbi:MAG: tripartite tricarboxylate transporter substrate binding protein [Desulfobacterales bacterium]|nr:tripartite tricarboxylate transporter substrate binding protein [Desulfobacterales bacterium]